MREQIRSVGAGRLSRGRSPSRSDANGRSIWSSDGVSEPVPYLGGDGEGAAFPLYLDSSIVWERGFNQSGSKFDRVELWASPLSPDPSQLEPFKVADLPLTSHAVGGSGYYAAGLDMQTVLLTHLQIYGRL